METPYGIRVNSVKDVSAAAFVKAYATHLKSGGKFRLPDAGCFCTESRCFCVEARRLFVELLFAYYSVLQWLDLVKTGTAKELAPYDADWLYIRAAAIARHLYFRPDQGVGAFKKLYGSKKRRGAAPGHHRNAAGGIVRYCLQQFQTMGIVQKGEQGGRRLTSKGQQEINSIARQIGSFE